VSPELLAVVVAGAIGIVGTIVGTVMTTWLGRSAERRRLASEDERRWLGDRRQAYSHFLTLSESMLREIDEVACFLSYDGLQDVPEEDESLREEGLFEYFGRWNEDLQPALGDVQLLAGGDVADLADRVSGALMQVTSVVERRGAFIEFYPGMFRAQDLLGVLRNAMRNELGLKDEIDVVFPRQAEWPWLQDRPSEEDYIRRQTQIPGRPPLTDVETARLARDEE
jgi:hypothetical protein